MINFRLETDVTPRSNASNGDLKQRTITAVSSTHPPTRPSEKQAIWIDNERPDLNQESSKPFRDRQTLNNPPSPNQFKFTPSKAVQKRSRNANNR